MVSVQEVALDVTIAVTATPKQKSNFFQNIKQYINYKKRAMVYET